MQPFVRIYSRLKVHRRLVWGLVALLWCCSLFLGSTMRLDTSSTSFFPDATPQLRHMVSALDMLPAARLLFVNISTEQDDATLSLVAAADALTAGISPELVHRVGNASLPDPSQLLALLPVLTDEADLQNYASQVQTLRADVLFKGIKEQLTGLWGPVVGPWLWADPFQWRQKLLQRLPQHSALPVNHPTWGYPVSADGKNLLLILRPEHSMRQVDKAHELIAGMEELFAPYAAQGLRLRAVGGHRHAAANANMIEQDIARIVLFSLFGFAGIYIGLVRSKGALWLLLTPALAASLAMGTMALCWPVVSGLALGFGASVLGIAEDFAVHMHFALRSGHKAEKVIGFLTYPLTCSVLLSASGFAVLLFSGIPAIRQLAFFALCMLGAGFLIAFIVIPLCPWSGQPPLSAALPLPVSPVPSLHCTTVWPLVGGVLLLVALTLGIFARVPVDVSPRSMGADMPAIQADMQYLQSIWGKPQGTAFAVYGATFTEALQRTKNLRDYLHTHMGQAATSSLVDIFPRPEEAQQRLQHWATFMNSHADTLKQVLGTQAAQYGFAPHTFAPFFQWAEHPARAITAQSLTQAGLGELFAAFVFEDVEKVQMLLITHSAYSGTLPEHLASYTSQLSEDTLDSQLRQSFSQEQKLLLLMFGLWGLLLVLCFRSLHLVLLAALPPLCTLVCVLGWFWCSNTPLTLAAIAALPLVLGLASDHGVVMTHAMGHDTDTKVERAMTVSSLTAIISMGLLAFSQHPVLHSMGLVIFLGLMVELPVSLWLIPCVYRYTCKAKP